MKVKFVKILAVLFIVISFIGFVFNMVTLKHRYEVNRIQTKEKVVMLTFDDGPTTADLAILDILKKENIHATFFMTGINLAKYDTNSDIKVVVNRIVNEGHTIGNHTYNHQEYLHKEDKLVKEIKATNELIKYAYSQNNIQISENDIPIRLSYLQYFKGLDYVQKQVGAKYFVRGYLGTDYNEEKSGKAKILHEYMSHLSKGKIFVCHTRDYAKEWLPELITQLKSKRL